MAKKKATGHDLVMFSRRIPRELAEEFGDVADSMVPRVSDTALLEAAMRDVIEKYRQQTKKGSEK